jgi:hypothetical protein
MREERNSSNERSNPFCITKYKMVVILLMNKSQRDGFGNGEFDPGSGRTLAVCFTHASRTG